MQREREREKVGITEIETRDWRRVGERSNFHGMYAMTMTMTVNCDWVRDDEVRDLCLSLVRD